MKIKTSVALDEGLMKTIDKEFGGRKNRSQLIEEAVKESMSSAASISIVISPILKSSIRNRISSIKKRRTFFYFKLTYEAGENCITSIRVLLMLPLQA